VEKGGTPYPSAQSIVHTFLSKKDVNEYPSSRLKIRSTQRGKEILAGEKDWNTVVLDLSQVFRIPHNTLPLIIYASLKY
jgi:hypothetical protein